VFVSNAIIEIMPRNLLLDRLNIATDGTAIRPRTFQLLALINDFVDSSYSYWYVAMLMSTCITSMWYITDYFWIKAGRGRWASVSGSNRSLFRILWHGHVVDVRRTHDRLCRQLQCKRD